MELTRAFSKYETAKGQRWRVWLKKGRKRLASKQGFTTKKAAKEWANEEETRMTQEWEKANAPTVTTYLSASNDYLSWGEPRWDRNTYVYKRGVYRAFLAFLKVNHPDGINAAPEEISSALIERHMYELAVKPKCSSKTSNRHKREIGAVFNHIINRGILTGAERIRQNINNPCRDIEPFAENHYVRPVPTFETVELYRAAAQGDESDYIEIMCNTIQRGRSVRCLSWDLIHFADRKAGFVHKKRKGGGGKVVWVYLNDTMLDILKKRFERRGDADQYVFINPETGDRFYRNNRFIKDLFSRLQERIKDEMDIKVEKITGHALRHWGAHELDANGVSQKQIGNMLGHQRETTTSIYLDEMRVDQAPAEKLEQLRRERQVEKRQKNIRVVK